MAEATFSGSVPERYDELLVPLIFNDYADEIVQRVHVASGVRVLEIACGTGVVTRKLRERLPEDTALIATDLSADMQAIAIANLHGVKGITFEIQDGTAMTYTENSFDEVVCQFGIMFYPDRPAGYAEAARVLKPGGKFIFNVWDSLENNPLFALADRALHTLIPDNPPPFLQIPFGCHDINEIRTALQDAGFGRINISVLPGTSRSDSARKVARTFVEGTPLAMALAEFGVDRCKDELESAIAAEYGNGPIAAPMQAIAFEATVVG